MTNKWHYYSSKRLLVFWIIELVIVSGTYILFKQILRFDFPFTSFTDSIVPFIVIVIVVLVALLDLIKGIKGLVTGKASGLSGKFSTEYRMERGKIAIRNKEYYGILGILRSLIRIVIGTVTLLVCGLIGIIFYQIFRSF